MWKLRLTIFQRGRYGDTIKCAVIINLWRSEQVIPKKSEKHKPRRGGMNICKMVRRLVQLHPEMWVGEVQQGELVRD